MFIGTAVSYRKLSVGNISLEIQMQISISQIPERGMDALFSICFKRKKQNWFRIDLRSDRFRHHT